MYCDKCGIKLPQDSDFCPYCMNKLASEKPTENIADKAFSGKKRTMIIFLSAAVLVIAAAAVIILFFIHNNGNNDNKEDVPAQGSSSVVSSESQTQPQTETDTQINSETQIQSQQSSSSSKSVSETVKTSASSKKTNNAKDEIRKAYRTIVNDYAAKSSPDTVKWKCYYLYDIDDDGVKELIVDHDGNGEFDFYTYKNGISNLGSINLHNSFLMAPRDGVGLLMCYAHMSYCSVARLTVSGNSTIKETYVDSADTDDYDTQFAMYGIKELEGTPLNDMSELNNNL